jgi:hypothetical protein
MGAEPQILLDREFGKGAATVGRMRDAAARDVFGLAPVDATAGEADFADRAKEPGNGAQRRRLAGAIGADERRDAAFLQAEAKSMQRLGRTVERAEISTSRSAAISSRVRGRRR